MALYPCSECGHKISTDIDRTSCPSCGAGHPRTCVKCLDCNNEIFVGIDLIDRDHSYLHKHRICNDCKKKIEREKRDKWKEAEAKARKESEQEKRIEKSEEIIGGAIAGAIIVAIIVAICGGAKETTIVVWATIGAIIGAIIAGIDEQKGKRMRR